MRGFALRFVGRAGRRVGLCFDGWGLWRRGRRIGAHDGLVDGGRTLLGLGCERRCPEGGRRLVNDRRAIDQAELSLLVCWQEPRAEPAEDVVDKRLGDRDLLVACEAARLETHVREL